MCGSNQTKNVGRAIQGDLSPGHELRCSNDTFSFRAIGPGCISFTDDTQFLPGEQTPVLKYLHKPIDHPLIIFYYTPENAGK
jgi:hypothetical protein